MDWNGNGSLDLGVVLKYLGELERNNEREWYRGHKVELNEACGIFEGVIGELILRIGEFDKSVLPLVPKDLTFKLVRDTRFSHDKSPYNPAFRAHISAGGKMPVPVGYFLMIKPGNQSFLGGGLFADVFKDATSMVRDFIAEHPEEWERVVCDLAFRELFTVQGSALKRVPAGYDKDHPMAEFLKMKSWYLEFPVDDDVLCNTEDFLDMASHVFRNMKAFNDVLNRALSGFRMPER